MLQRGAEAQDAAIGFEGDAELLVEVAVDLPGAPVGLLRQRLHTHLALRGVDKPEQAALPLIHCRGQEGQNLLRSRGAEGVKIGQDGGAEAPEIIGELPGAIQESCQGRVQDVLGSGQAEADGEHERVGREDSLVGPGTDADEHDAEGAGCGPGEEEIDPAIGQADDLLFFAGSVVQHPEAVDEGGEGRRGPDEPVFEILVHVICGAGGSRKIRWR